MQNEVINFPTNPFSLHEFVQRLKHVYLGSLHSSVRYKDNWSVQNFFVSFHDFSSVEILIIHISSFVADVEKLSLHWFLYFRQV